jgi:hypothetical protein
VQWRVVTAAVLALACVVSALAGGYLAIRAFGTTVEPFTLGTARVAAVPALDGRVDVYVPIVDWGVRATPYSAPWRSRSVFARSTAKKEAPRSGPVRLLERGLRASVATSLAWAGARCDVRRSSGSQAGSSAGCSRAA